MKRLLLAFCVVASAANAQSDIGTRIVGNWSVVDIRKLTIPPGPNTDPSKVEMYRDVLKSMRFEFRDDHHFIAESSNPDFEVQDGYWELKGNTIAIDSWEAHGRSTTVMRVNVEQRDATWFFAVAGIAELEVRKD